MIQMLRKGSCSGEIADLAHVRTEDCLSDFNIKAGNLIKAVESGILNHIDAHPSFRELLKRRAYLHQWITMHSPRAAVVACLMGAPLHQICREQPDREEVPQPDQTIPQEVDLD